MELGRIRGLLRGIDPIPIFFATLFRMLDLLTTRLCLILIPGTYEGMTLGNSLPLSLGFILMPMVAIQLFCSKWHLPHMGRAGSWLLVVVSLIPILNNLELLNHV